MTETEYKKELAEIEASYVSAKSNLYRKYAALKRAYSVGDIIRNHVHTIKIEKYGTYMDWQDPIPTYIGVELKKDLTPKKKQETAVIYGNRNIEKLN